MVKIKKTDFINPKGFFMYSGDADEAAQAKEVTTTKGGVTLFYGNSIGYGLLLSFIVYKYISMLKKALPLASVKDNASKEKFCLVVRVNSRHDIIKAQRIIDFINLGSFGWSNKSISQEVEHFLSNYTYRFELSMLYKAVNNFLVDKEGQLI